MDALDFAMQKEKEAEEFYTSLANDCSDTGLKNIMLKLASVEVKHYEVLKEVKNVGSSQIEMPKDAFRSEFKTLFTALAEQTAEFSEPGKQVDMYKLAQGREDEAHKFYLEQVDKMPTDEGKALFSMLAEQEQLHFDILDSIIEFVGRAEPGNWLETAEWYHTDEY